MSKDQFVIACVESPESASVVLPWARHFATRLNNKGLFALHVSTEGATPDWLTQLGVPYVSLRGDWHTAIEGLPTAFNCILAITAVNTDAARSSLTHPKTLLNEFKNCKTAYLCINTKYGDNSSDIQIPSAALTMTHRREGKEKLVWASYLARFLNSRITLTHPEYRDKDFRMRWRNNMRFVDKMFTPLGITYDDCVIEASEFKDTHPDLDTLDQVHPTLLIARTTDTRDRDLFDIISFVITRQSSLNEYRILTHPSHTPVLFLNPRDDLYILCD